MGFIKRGGEGWPKEMDRPRRPSRSHLSRGLRPTPKKGVPLVFSLFFIVYSSLNFCSGPPFSPYQCRKMLCRGRRMDFLSLPTSKCRYSCQVRMWHHIGNGLAFLLAQYSSCLQNEQCTKIALCIVGMIISPTWTKKCFLTGQPNGVTYGQLT